MKFKTTLIVVAAVLLSNNITNAQTPAELNDLQIAHVAYIADNIDIRYAHLALAISENPEIHEFAKRISRNAARAAVMGSTSSKGSFKHGGNYAGIYSGYCCGKFSNQ